MRHLALVLLVAAACGGGAKPTTATTTAPVAAETPMPEYCQEYEACAAEEPLMEREASSLDDLAPADRAAVEAAIDAELARCHTVWDGLTPHQRDWLVACTGCGGSCDVWDCIDQAGAIGEADAFECGMGEDDSGDEDDGDGDDGDDDGDEE
ncbi:MAG: hypothetical protein KA201_31495 [Kofleriaceae bacterium]|jgi:hypothetical protein|nr:hypothetical protein [Kofleriaceae bacterium]